MAQIYPGMADGTSARPRSPRGRARACWFLGLLVAAGLSGCEADPEPIAIVPDPAKGRQAIEAAMASWKAGHPAGVVEPTSPRIQLVDTHRKPGQALVGFEILADSADARVRTFSLRLALSGPEERPVVRFLVVGIDPILVFRQEDYELLMHWEHAMPPAPEPAAVPESK